MTISNTMRDVLIDHIDGVAMRYLVPKNASGPDCRRQWNTLRAVEALRQRGHLKRSGAYTTITDRGRELLAELLASYAEKLIRDQIEEPTREDYGGAMLRLACAAKRVQNVTYPPIT